MEDVKANLGPTKRRIIERLKRADAKVADLARVLDMTEAGVRQHLDALADHGLVTSRTGTAAGRGRPATVWTLTDLAEDLFPDRHDDLTVELITAVRTALGDDGLAKVIDARGEKQRVAYERALPKRGSVRARVEALARVRTDEGYVAEVVDDPDGDRGAARRAPLPDLHRGRRRAPACAVRSSSSSARCSARRCRWSAPSTSSPATGAAPIAFSPSSCCR